MYGLQDEFEELHKDIKTKKNKIKTLKSKLQIAIEALENIVKHMNIVGDDYASLSTVVVIAKSALEQIKEKDKC